MNHLRSALASLVFLLGLGCGDDDGTGADAGFRDASSARDAGAIDAAGETVDAASELDAAGERDAASVDAASAVDVGPMDAGPPVDPLEGAGDVEEVATGYMGDDFGFLEGPHWRDGVLLFSDLFFGDPARRTIYALTPPDVLTIFLRPSGGANGNATSAEGEHISCLQVGRRVVRIPDDGGEPVTLFDRYEGEPLRAPNDLVVRRDGAWYFTDPAYGAEEAATDNPRGVYFVDGEDITRVLDLTNANRPNGVVLSPDDSVLYLADTQQNVVRAYDVAADGSLSAERMFAEAPGPDGMSVDEAGNVYVTAANGVRVFAPDGDEWGTITVPQRPANCGFGDADRRTLYITARTGLYRVRLGIPGIEGR